MKRRRKLPPQREEEAPRGSAARERLGHSTRSPAGIPTAAARGRREAAPAAAPPPPPRRGRSPRGDAPPRGRARVPRERSAAPRGAEPRESRRPAGAAPPRFFGETGETRARARGAAARCRGAPRKPRDRRGFLGESGLAGKPAHCAGRHALRIMAKTRSISPAVFVPAGIGLDRSRKRIYSEPRGNPHQNGEIVERDGGEDPRDYGEVLGELCRGEAEAVERGQNRGTERSVGAEKREELAHDGLVETPRFPRTSCWSSAVRSGSSRISSRCSDGEQIYSENRGAAHGERFEEAGDQRRSFGEKVRPAKLVQQRVQRRRRR